MQGQLVLRALLFTILGLLPIEWVEFDRKSEKEIMFTI